MAKYRETPTCPFCGEIIAKGVYKKTMGDWIGDNFLYWDFLDHDCKKKPILTNALTIDDFIRMEADALLTLQRNEAYKELSKKAYNKNAINKK